MKKIIAGWLLAAMFIPAVSFAQTSVVQTLETTETIETQLKYIDLLQQLIQLLQLKLELQQQLQGLSPLPLVLGAATSTEEAEEEPRRRRGGGGSSSSRTVNVTEADTAADVSATSTESTDETIATSTDDMTEVATSTTSTTEPANDDAQVSSATTTATSSPADSSENGVGSGSDASGIVIEEIIQTSDQRVFDRNGSFPDGTTHWFPSSWGNSPIAHVFPEAGINDEYAIRVEVTDYVDGDAKWAFEDIDVPFNNYTFWYRDYYRASIVSQVAVRYQTIDGGSGVVELGVLPATDTWQEARYDFELPDNATSFTVHHLIKDTGWLELDEVAVWQLVAGDQPSTGLNDDLQALINDLLMQVANLQGELDIPVDFDPMPAGQDTQDLMQWINDLLAQVADLQSQLGQGSDDDDVIFPVPTVCPYTWTRNLSIGSQGADVMRLQQFLNAYPDTRVANSGVGSAGNETTDYNAAVAAAVSKFQVLYRSEILTPQGLVNPTGEFGSSERAKINALCAVSMDDGPIMLSGAALLDYFEVDEADSLVIDDGRADQPIAELELEFIAGDAELTYIDLTFDSALGAAPWGVFEDISVWVDGDKVAEVAADDENDYLDPDTGFLRLSNLDTIALEDEGLEIVVAVSVQDTIDFDGLGGWTVAVESLRFFDGDGVATTETTGFDFGREVFFEIQRAGADDELIVRSSSNDPDSSILLAEEEVSSDWYNIFVFGLETDDSSNDIEIDTLSISIETTVT